MRSNPMVMRALAFLRGSRWLIGITLVAVVPHASAHNAAEIVATESGPVRGAFTSDGRQFLGIPYAAPPVGELRWREPRPALKWRGVRSANEFGNNCPQFGTFFGLESFDEDCLFLNVYTPKPGTGFRRDPVMVWFHPGAFEFGESDDYDPRKLTARGVIVVTVNYRLGALGFLAHPALTAESAHGTSGNYGLMDQQAALKWVRKNIERFGGDADNVTVFGESAGGFSGHAHLVSPKSRGLFDRVIVESGAYSLKPPTLASAEAGGVAFANSVGCAANDLKCLRALPVPTVLAKQQPGLLGFLPNVDGVVIPTAFDEAFASGRFNRVPVLEGSTHDEYRLFVPLFFDFVGGPISQSLYPTAISILLGVPPASVPAIVAEYPLNKFSSPDVAAAAAATDAVFACNRQNATSDISRFVPTYVYEFNDQNAPQRHLPPATFPYGAAHESELQYLFDIVTTLPAIPLNADQEKLSHTMVGYWTNFAYTGNPNIGPHGFSLPIWFRNNFVDYVHSLKAPRPEASSEAAFAKDHHCKFWRTFFAN